MEYEIAFEKSLHFIRIITRGEIRAEDTAKMALDGLAVGKEVGCEVFLIDYRKSTVSDSLTNTYKTYLAG